MVGTPGSDVAVEAHRARSRKDALHFFFEAFRADTEQRSLGVAAAMTGFRNRTHVVAVMTAKVMRGGVKDQGDVAIIAAFGVSTLETEDACGEAPPVEKENRLAALSEGLRDCGSHRLRESR